MRHNYRCGRNDCRKRVTLAHRLEWYLRAPKCKGCGRRGTLNHDPEVARRHRRETCRCGGIMWPHREGTVLSENEFCHALTLDQVVDRLIERGVMSREEANQL